MATVTVISPVTGKPVEHKRVAAYCRVSSNSADQNNSYQAQIRYFTRHIKANRDWELVDIFADEGISGTSAEKRDDFNRMITMCELKQIDLILTKSVSRFARNVKEALNYTRKLKLLGIGVQFEEDGINTLAMADEMLLNTFAAIAQEESKSISQHQRLSIVKRMELGEYIDSNAPYGYRLINKTLSVYEPEAIIVRWIYQSYLNAWSISEIAKDLSVRDVPTKCGKSTWTSTRVSYILSHARYIGDCKYQKTCREAVVPFRQSKNRGQEDMFYAKETHAPLLDKQLFYQVQELLEKKKKQHCTEIPPRQYPLTSRIRCSECGSFYHRKVRSGVIKWVCSKHAADTTACNSNYYSEERIYDGIITMINKLRFCEEDILGQTIQKLEFAAAAYKRNNRAASLLSQSMEQQRSVRIA